MPKFITKRCLRNFDPDSFLEDLRNTSWFNLFMTEDANHAAEMLTNELANVLDKHAPTKTGQIRKIFAPWLKK